MHGNRSKARLLKLEVVLEAEKNWNNYPEPWTLKSSLLGEKFESGKLGTAKSQVNCGTSYEIFCEL